MCQQTAEYLVPCSTQSQFPYLWSAALRCTHGMAILGDPGADEMGVPSRSCNPRERNWEPLPIPPMSRPPPHAPRVRSAPAALPARSQPQWRPPGAQQGPTPHPQRAESRPVQPRFTPPWVRSRSVSSRSGHLREHNWEALPQPRPEPTPALHHPGSPRPCRAPGALPTFTSGSW